MKITNLEGCNLSYSSVIQIGSGDLLFQKFLAKLSLIKYNFANLILPQLKYMKEFDEDEIYYEMYIHLLWSTVDQKNILPSPFPLLYNYLSDLTLNEECHLIGGSVHSDHVQLVIKFTPYTVVSNLITNLKVGSLLWMRTNFSEIKNFEWQKSEFGFSVSVCEVGALIERIKNAKSFKDEVIILLDQNEMEYDLIEVFE